jgi:hypothetical protein
MKITEQNRSLVFLAVTMLIGVLIVGGLMFFENTDVEAVEIVDKAADTNIKTLESKIKNLKTQNFNPSSYNTIATEIDGSYQQELITIDAKTNLMSSLSSVYSDLIYSQCETFLSNNYGNSDDITSWLSQLEKITSKNARIDKYFSQIKWYNYYSGQLPKLVDDFVGKGIQNYDEDKYKSLIKEVNEMPNFEPAYKNQSKFNKIKAELISKLQSYNAEFYVQ